MESNTKVIKKDKENKRKSKKNNLLVIFINFAIKKLKRCIRIPANTPPKITEVMKGFIFLYD